MSERVRLTWKDLNVGMTVPWNIFDLEGKKLLAAGQELRSKQMLEQLCQYVLYHDLPDVQHTAQKATQGKLNVFEITGDYISRLERIYKELEESNPDCVDKILHLAKDIQSLCEREPDAVLAVIHVKNEYPYILFHPLQCAYLSILIAKRAGFTDDECDSLAVAALLANIGMRDTQDALAGQQAELKPDQNDTVSQHPRKSVDILLAIGFNNVPVHNIILEHHERCDGSGYPDGLKRDDICRGALVLGVADYYGAMVSPRSYRESLTINGALQKLFMDKGHYYEPQFSLLLIKQLTVFPPGSFVKLTNGEIAIVICRGGMSPMEPLMKSIVGANGEPYANPLVRDLSIHDYEIESICAYESEHPLNYGKLWDYI